MYIPTWQESLPSLPAQKVLLELKEPYTALHEASETTDTSTYCSCEEAWALGPSGKIMVRIYDMLVSIILQNPFLFLMILREWSYTNKLIYYD